MIKEKETFELTEEELEKVTGGEKQPNDEGNYVFLKGEKFIDPIMVEIASIYTVLESKTGNVNDYVYCEIDPSLPYIPREERIRDDDVKISKLIQCRKLN